MSYYDLSEDAQSDWEDIARYTLRNFGEEQLLKYTNELAACIEQMAIGKGIFKDFSISRYMVRMKRCHKHYVFATADIARNWVILAILHERMDWMKRLGKRMKPLT